MESSVTGVYDIVDKLSDFILSDSTNNKISNRVYLTYNSLLEGREFSKTAVTVNLGKIKFLKNWTKPSGEEKAYFDCIFHKIINVFMDVLLAFVLLKEPGQIKPIRFATEKWPSLVEYWMNSNRNTALDDSYIIKTANLPVTKQPKDFKLEFRMFVLRCVILSELLHFSIPNYSSLSQFNVLYNQCRCLAN